MKSLRAALIGLGIAGLVLGLLSLAAVDSSDHAENKGVNAVLVLLIGWSFIGTGLFVIGLVVSVFYFIVVIGALSTSEFETTY